MTTGYNIAVLTLISLTGRIVCYVWAMWIELRSWLEVKLVFNSSTVIHIYFPLKDNILFFLARSEIAFFSELKFYNILLSP